MNFKISLLISEIDRYKGAEVINYSGYYHLLKELNCGLILNGATVIDEICYGNEFCEYLIPSIYEIKQLISICERDGLKLVLVTPPVTDIGLERINSVLGYLSKFENCFGGIIINDLGVLELIEKTNLKCKVALGRLLDRTDHESRCDTNTLLRYYGKGIITAQTLGILSHSAVNLWHKYNLDSVGFDLPNFPLVIEENMMHYDIYLPYTYITTGRICSLFYSNGESNPFLIENKRCIQLCRDIRIKLHSEKYNDDLIKKGNTIFSYSNMIANGDTIKKSSRIIYQLI